MITEMIFSCFGIVLLCLHLISTRERTSAYKPVASGTSHPAANAPPWVSHLQPLPRLHTTPRSLSGRFNRRMVVCLTPSRHISQTSAGPCGELFQDPSTVSPTSVKINHRHKTGRAATTLRPQETSPLFFAASTAAAASRGAAARRSAVALVPAKKAGVEFKREAR